MLKQEIDTFIPQAKMLRIFELLTLMAHTKSTVDQLAGALDHTPRTIYRYFKLLQEINFQVVEHKKPGCPVRYSLGTDYYPVFVGFFREDVWKIKARIKETPEQKRMRELNHQFNTVENG